MARTSFSGPVASANGFEGALTGVVTPTSLVLPTSTSAALGAASNAVNTAGKVANRAVYNTTTKTIYVAQGALATSTWIDAGNGSTTITPA